MRINTIFGDLRAAGFEEEERVRVQNLLRDIVTQRRRIPLDNDVCALYDQREAVSAHLGVRGSVLDVLWRVPTIRAHLEAAGRDPTRSMATTCSSGSLCCGHGRSACLCGGSTLNSDPVPDPDPDPDTDTDTDPSAQAEEEAERRRADLEEVMVAVIKDAVDTAFTAHTRVMRRVMRREMAVCGTAVMAFHVMVALCAIALICTSSWSHAHARTHDLTSYGLMGHAFEYNGYNQGFNICLAGRDRFLDLARSVISPVKDTVLTLVKDFVRASSLPGAWFT